MHHIYEETKLKDIFEEARKAHHENRVYYFFSTSKITFPGSGVALMASSESNIKEPGFVSYVANSRITVPLSSIVAFNSLLFSSTKITAVPALSFAQL